MQTKRKTDEDRVKTCPSRGKGGGVLMEGQAAHQYCSVSAPERVVGRQINNGTQWAAGDGNWIQLPLDLRGLSVSGAGVWMMDIWSGRLDGLFGKMSGAQGLIPPSSTAICCEQHY